MNRFITVGNTEVTEFWFNNHQKKQLYDSSYYEDENGITAEALDQRNGNVVFTLNFKRGLEEEATLTGEDIPSDAFLWLYKNLDVNGIERFSFGSHVIPEFDCDITVKHGPKR